MSILSIKTGAIALVLGGAIASAVSASAALNLPTMSCSYKFNTNMKHSSRGADVSNLQKVLNMYPQTRVAVSGAGSPGMETSTFGPATHTAVNRFQALHLAELGINSPSGNVFAGTRGLLNQVCTGGNTGGNVLPPGCTSTAGFSPVTGQMCSAGGNPGGTTSGPVSVMLSNMQPTGQLVVSQAAARLADFTFTGNGTVTNIELQRTGVSTDSTLNNVYLYDGNVRLTDAASVVTGGFIRFNAGSGLFTVNGTRTITVRADIASGTGGNAVGVKLNSVTAMGSSAATFTNVMGNVLTIASNVTPATVNFNVMVGTPRFVDAGTTNYNVWSGTANVGTRDVYLKAATFKFVGSAPVDSAANLSLFVDGARVAGPAMVNPTNNNKVVFDLGSMPQLIRTGSHTIDVRGDIMKGSNRTMTFSVENVADLMFEDRDLTGVNVAATVTGLGNISSGNSVYGTILVNKGSAVVNVDPSFVANKVTGGATNMTISSFTIKAYGEDVKVNTLQVTPNLPFGNGTTLPSPNGLTNVGLFLNGGQIGSSQNWAQTGTTTPALNFNLGSSLIIPAGQSVTVSVKADIKSQTSVSYTAGAIFATIGGLPNNAQGQSSNELTDVALSPVSGNALTISSGAGQFARTSGFTDKTTAPNTTAVRIGSFTLQADSAEDTVVNGATVSLVTSYSLSNVSNLTLKVGNQTLGTPIGNVTASNTISFSDVVIPMNSTRTFDVFADIGGVSAGTVKADLSLSTRGPVSGTVATLAATGITTTSVTATLANATRVSSSAVAQYVVGSSNMVIATFKLQTATGDAVVRELRYTLTGTDAIESVTVNGITANFVAGFAAKVTGISIPVSTTGTDVAVSVKYAGFKNATTNGSLTAGIASVSVAQTYIEATSGNGSVISNSNSVPSNTMKLYASKPTVTGMNGSGTLSAGTMKLGEFTVTADANGGIAIGTTSVVTSWSTGGTTTVANAHIRENGNTSALTNNVGSVTTGTAYNLGFLTPYTLSAGQSKVFEVWGTIGNTGGFGVSAQVATQLNPDQSLFIWNDTVSASVGLTGVGILNFPNTSFLVKNY